MYNADKVCPMYKNKVSTQLLCLGDEGSDDLNESGLSHSPCQNVYVSTYQKLAQAIKLLPQTSVNSTVSKSLPNLPPDLSTNTTKDQRKSGFLTECNKPPLIA